MFEPVSDTEAKIEINEDIENNVNSQLINLLSPEISSKLLNLLAEEDDTNNSNNETSNILTYELKSNINSELENSDVTTEGETQLTEYNNIKNKIETDNTVMQSNDNIFLTTVTTNASTPDITNLIQTAVEAAVKTSVEAAIKTSLETAVKTSVEAAIQAFMQSKATSSLETINSQPSIAVDALPLIIEEKKMSEIDQFLDNKNVKFKTLEGHTQLEPKLTEVLVKLVSNKEIKTVMEIGFNAGHSADTFLKSNESISLVSFDIATHSYVDIGKTYIDKKYPERHTLIKGDSRVTITEYFNKNPETKFDLIFIDGGHSDNVPRSDLSNCRLFAHKNTIVIMNDVKYKNIESWNVNPNEAWDAFVESNSIDELKHIEFPPLNGLSYGKYNLCEIYICSLLRSDRMTYIENNQKLFPFIKIFNSVNGYNTKETVQQMNELKLKFVDLDAGFKTYGTLACWLTKYKMLKYQVDHEIPFLCFIEDDIILEKNFYTFVSDALSHFKSNVNILRLMTWGEGYITSYESAKRVLDHLNRDGIIRNIDNQLREHCGYEIALKNTPMKVMIAGNKGDSGKTKNLSEFNIHDWC